MVLKAEKYEKVPNNNEEEYVKLVAPQASPRKYKLSYMKVFLFVYWHAAGLYGLYLLFTAAQWPTVVFTFATYLCGAIGITAGAHRLWSHRTYKAKLPLEVLLMAFQSLAYQKPVLQWVRDHRLHHKYSDTDADPHNATRGLFYSHIGWLLVQKHPEVIKREKSVDLSDIYNNPVVRFQIRYSLIVMAFFALLLPISIPMYCWGESLNNAWHIAFFRHIFLLHVTCLINSAAHAYGNKPYDKYIMATQNVSLCIMTLGECFHNYHHVFPWDYRTAELGNNKLNFTTKFIDFFAWLGWAYDLKTVSDEMIAKRAQRTGDGTNLWGWGDKDLKVQGEEGDKEMFNGWEDDLADEDE